jgi:hypothetical protein
MVQCSTLNSASPIGTGMASASGPQTPLFRTTLFFGPEPVAGADGTMRCVFNVKKRSWKCGIQVEVRLAERDLDRSKTVLGYEPWAQGALTATPADDRDTYRRRAADLLAQKLCAVKLDLALEAGVAQENQVLDPDQLVGEFDAAVPSQEAAIKNWILAELDIEAS